jgi:GAF domain-containing protein
MSSEVSAAGADQDLRRANERLERELAEAREQQATTAEILRVISGAPMDSQRVFAEIAASAARLCDAYDAGILQVEGDVLRSVAHQGPIPTLGPVGRATRPLVRGIVMGRAVLDRQTIQVADLQAEGDEYPEGSDFARRLGHRTILAVPLVRASEAIGVIVLRRTEVRPFTDRQIDLLKTFADQAVIAIENTRLFEAEQASKRELQESLEYQTATSDVLGVISRSPSNLQPVLDAIVGTAARLCQADVADVRLLRDGLYHIAATTADDPMHVRSLRDSPIAPGRGSITGRVALERRTIHLPDIRADPEYTYGPGPIFPTLRTILGVPLLGDGVTIGAIVLFNRVLRPFTQKQIALVNTFADQAVIAIENTRLFEAEQARAKELHESLEYQTATADVLEVISKSPNDVKPVLEAIALTSSRLCQADDAHIFLLSDGKYRLAAVNNPDKEWVRVLSDNPLTADTRGSVTGRAIREKRVVQIEDTQADPEHAEGLLGRQPRRTVISVPLLRESEVVGAITLNRRTVNPFTLRQTVLLETFADQAVIAIENTRLFEAEQTRSRELTERTQELTETLEHQTATSEVLGVISRSKFDLQPVLDTIATVASRLCAADATILLRHDEDLRVAAHHGLIPQDLDIKLPIARGWVSGRAVMDRQPIHVHDIVVALGEFPLSREIVARFDLRTVLSIPLQREDNVVGCLSLRRTVVQPFTEKQIALLRTFADQAVIAIENTRLFEEVQARTGELSDALERQTATSEVLNVISRSPTQLQPVLDSIVATAADLCQADFAMIHRLEHEKFRLVAANKVESDSITWLAQNPPTAGPGSVSGRAVAECATIQIPDVLADPEYSRTRAESLKRGNQRTTLGVPLLREGVPIGVIALHRTEVRPFTDKQIELVTIFADQAVIAIENTRLFEAEQASKRELQESLEYQTATSEVLSVISTSPGELAPVFEAMLSNAVRICEAKFGVLWLAEGDGLRSVALHGAPPALVESRQRNPVVKFEPSTPLGRAISTKRIVHVDDMTKDPSYLERNERAVNFVERAGVRSVVFAPMLRESGPIGVFTIYRQEVRPFTDRQIELVKSFASQAVIAIENTRLLSELREALQQQTATAEVLKVISRATFDLPKVLDTLVESAASLCDSYDTAIWQKDGDVLRIVSNLPHIPSVGRGGTVPLTRGSAAGRAVLDRQMIHLADMQSEMHEYPESVRTPGVLATIPYWPCPLLALAT